MTNENEKQVVDAVEADQPANAPTASEATIKTTKEKRPGLLGKIDLLVEIVGAIIGALG